MNKNTKNQDIKKLSKVNLNYYAGIIDGEGSLKMYVRPTKNGLGKVYNCVHSRLEVTNTDFKLIKAMKRDFGIGFIYKDKPRRTEKGTLCKPIARWTIQYQKLYKFLKVIRPFLRIKSKTKEADKIIKYYETRKGKPRIK